MLQNISSPPPFHFPSNSPLFRSQPTAVPPRTAEVRRPHRTPPTLRPFVSLSLSSSFPVAQHRLAQTEPAAPASRPLPSRRRHARRLLRILFRRASLAADHRLKMSARGRGRLSRLARLFPGSQSSPASQPTSSSSSSSGVPEMRGLSLGEGSSSGDSSEPPPSSAASAVDASGRTYCYISEARTLSPEFAVAQFITQTFHKYLEVGAYAWRVVSEETKTTYWEEFQKHFYWDEGLDDHIYSLWAAKAARRYSDMLSSLKRKRCDHGRSIYVPETVWASWCCYWDSAAAMTLSQTAKKNRLSEPDGEGTGQIRHRGGSRSAAAHARALAQESGGGVAGSLYATFRRYHYKDGDYTDSKSRRIGEEVERRIALASQPLPDGTQPPPVDPNEIYLEVIDGRSSKNRIFGIGSLYTWSQSASSPSGTSSHNFSFPQTVSSQRLEQQIIAQVDAEVEARIAATESRFREEMAAMQAMQQQRKEMMRAEMRAQLDSMMDAFIRASHQSQPQPHHRRSLIFSDTFIYV